MNIKNSKTLLIFMIDIMQYFICNVMSIKFIIYWQNWYVNDWYFCSSEVVMSFLTNALLDWDIDDVKNKNNYISMGSLPKL